MAVVLALGFLTVGPSGSAGREPPPDATLVTCKLETDERLRRPAVWRECEAPRGAKVKYGRSGRLWTATASWVIYP